VLFPPCAVSPLWCFPPAVSGWGSVWVGLTPRLLSFDSSQLISPRASARQTRAGRCVWPLRVRHSCTLQHHPSRHDGAQARRPADNINIDSLLVPVVTIRDAVLNLWRCWTRGRRRGVVPVMVHWLRTVMAAVRRSWACSLCTLAQMLRHKLLSNPFIRRNSLKISIFL